MKHTVVLFTMVVIAAIAAQPLNGDAVPELKCLFMKHHRIMRTLCEIENSHHDFSSAAWAGQEVCRPCHTPHDADQTVTAAPLWNHQVTSASFTVYSSTTMDAIPGQPGGVSKLCLSCHDGTVAIENHSGSSSGNHYVNFGNVGTDLSDDHPISFAYSSALATADGELKDPSSTASGLGGTIDDDMLVGGMLECSSCHDVHVARNTQGCIGCHSMHHGVTETLSLRKSNAGSALCLTCHDK